MKNQKRIRNILLVVWVLLLGVNLLFVLWNPSILGWFVVGFLSGGILVMCIDNKILNLQDKLIKLLKDLNEIQSKKLKGGKRR